MGWASSVPPSFRKNEDTATLERALIACSLHIYNSLSSPLAHTNSLNTALSQSALKLYVLSSKEADKQLHKIQITKIT